MVRVLGWEVGELVLVVIYLLGDFGLVLSCISFFWEEVWNGGFGLGGGGV